MASLRSAAFLLQLSAPRREALAALSVRRFDLLITDLQMPEMDGRELLCRVQEDYPLLRRIVITGYTIFTLAMMGQYGRRTWSEHGEVFSVWFGLIGRLAPLAPVPGDDRVVRRRDFASGLLESGWAAASDIVIIGLATGSILFDGLSQTQVWVSTFGLPAALPQTLLLAGFLGLIVGAALVVARLVGIPATAAGKDYFGTAFFEPTADWLPPGLVWTLQLAAVVGGHMIGAWAGHVVAAGVAGRHGTLAAREVRLRQVPLAVVMVGLTTLTLWSLGQALFIAPS